MTYNLLYKVGNNKYKTFTKGEYIKVSKAFDDLHKRATDKNFKIISRSAGNMGVELCYCDGKQSVYLLICNDDERKLWWFEKIEY
jgi:lipoate synthase